MSDFAPPLSKLGDSGIGVAAAPTGGMGLALDPTGQLPASVLPAILTTWPTGTPDPGEEFIYSPANGVNWRFKYDSRQSSSGNWVFVGGSPWIAQVTTDQSTASTSYVNLTTTGPTITLPSDGPGTGTYLLEYGCQMYNSGAGNINLAGISIGGSTPSDTIAARQRAGAATTLDVMSLFKTTATVNAGNALKVQYRVSAGTGNFANRFLSVTPLWVT